MSQKPAKRIQITRIPQPAPSGPSRRQPAGKQRPSGSDVCPHCGAIVGNWNLHDEFHVGIASLMRWAKRVNQVLAEDESESGE